jgi:hypothetical protein
MPIPKKAPHYQYMSLCVCVTADGSWRAGVGMEVHLCMFERVNWKLENQLKVQRLLSSNPLRFHLANTSIWEDEYPLLKKIFEVFCFCCFFALWFVFSVRKISQSVPSPHVNHYCSLKCPDKGLGTKLLAVAPLWYITAGRWGVEGGGGVEGVLKWGHICIWPPLQRKHTIRLLHISALICLFYIRVHQKCWWVSNFFEAPSICNYVLTIRHYTYFLWLKKAEWLHFRISDLYLAQDLRCHLLKNCKQRETENNTVRGITSHHMIVQ